MGATVLLVGVGRFGAHYARILSGLGTGRGAGARPVERLVLTRTRQGPAQRLAAALRSDPACTAEEVVGIPVADEDALASAVKRFSPDLTCITATDPKTGDAIHATYAETALRSGSGGLLCEKPLCPTTGDGKSISAVHRLKRAGGAGRFGLELPMAVVRREMAADAELGPRLEAAGRLSFFWSTTAPLRAELIDTLALHPWSLIPERLHPERIESRCGPERCDIAGRLRDRQTGAAVVLEISLCSGDNLRTMTIDGSLFTVFSRGPTVSVLAGGAGRQSSGQDQKGGGRVLLSVENPLAQNIEASLAGAPTTGLDRTEAAQRFLEMAKGWPGTCVSPGGG